MPGFAPSLLLEKGSTFPFRVRESWAQAASAAEQSSTLHRYLAAPDGALLTRGLLQQEVSPGWILRLHGPLLPSWDTFLGAFWVIDKFKLFFLCLWTFTSPTVCQELRQTCMRLGLWKST